MSDVTHEEIMGRLGLLPWEEHRAAVLARDAYGTQYERGTGRTTWACVEALRACMSGRDAVIHVSNSHAALGRARETYDLLVDMAGRLGLTWVARSGRVRISAGEIAVVLYAEAADGDRGPLPREDLGVGHLAVRITDRSMDRTARVGAEVDRASESELRWAYVRSS